MKRSLPHDDRRGPHDLVGHTGERGRDPGEQVHKGRSFSRSLNTEFLDTSF